MAKHFSVLFIVIVLVCVLFGCNSYNIKNPYVKEYVPGQGNIVGAVDIDYYAKINEAFEIGASANGYAVFKDPNAAFKTLKEMYSEGIDAIQNEFNLSYLSPKNYKDYKTYGWQVSTGSEAEKEQARFVSGFLDIYKNSFK